MFRQAADGAAPDTTRRSSPRAGKPRRDVSAKGKTNDATQVGAAAGQPDEAAEATFQSLREWRANVARDRGVPAYVIFHDSTLRAMATSRPATLDDLRGVSGVGDAKLEAFGPAVLGIVGDSKPDPAAESLAGLADSPI
jgi:ATP-dependent DNA helicase RecQ